MTKEEFEKNYYDPKDVFVVDSPQKIYEVPSGSLVSWKVNLGEGENNAWKKGISKEYAIATSPETFATISKDNERAFSEGRPEETHNIVLRGFFGEYPTDSGYCAVDSTIEDTLLLITSDDGELRYHEVSPTGRFIQGGADVDVATIAESEKDLVYYTRDEYRRLSMDDEDSVDVGSENESVGCNVYNYNEVDSDNDNSHVGKSQVVTECHDFIEIMKAAKNGEIIRIAEGCKLPEYWEDMYFNSGKTECYKMCNDGKYREIDEVTGKISADEAGFYYDNTWQDLII